MSETPNDRLRKARIRAGFETPADAARRFGWNENTYKSHENGARGFKRDGAVEYARAFRVSPSWLLLGGDTNHNVVSEIIDIPVAGVASGGIFRMQDAVAISRAGVPAMNIHGVDPSHQYALQVDGPSVDREIPEGAFAICVPLEHMPGGFQHGDLVHLERQRAGLVENSIKEARFGPKGVSFWPKSTHPDHQEPVCIDDTDADTMVIVKGVVVGSFKPFRRA